MLRRAVAVILITLVATPFTAPFSTCDLATVDVLHLGVDSLSAAKVAQDVAAIPSMVSRGLPVHSIEPLLVRPAVFYFDIGKARSLVLRL